MVSSSYVVLLSVLVEWCAASFDSFSIISNREEDEVPVAPRLRRLQELSSTINVSSSSTSSSFISSSNKGIPFDPDLVNKCLGGFAGLGFSLFDLERYDDYFRDDSIMTLAQAGSYKGSSNIEEYVRFGSAFSPYVAAADPSERIRTSPQLRSIDDVAGTCDFTVVVKREMEMDGRTTAYASRFSFAEMTRFTYDYGNNYIKRMNIYLNDGFFQFYMGTMLDSNNTRNFICNQVLNGVCNFGIQKCQQQLRKLDVFNGGTYFDGNSQSCRALHAAFALTNPTQHCPHVSLKPMEDSNGQIKCQESQVVLIEDLFAEKDLLLYEEFEIFHRIDPDVGISETCNKACAQKRKGKATGRALL